MAKSTKTSDVIFASPESSSPIEPRFRKPGSMEWESLLISSTRPAIDTDAMSQSLNKSEQAKESLKNTLLQSLQMQHIILLAGSGCSFYADGPKMGDLWISIVEGEHKEDAKYVADKINYNIEENNIESFLSQIEAAGFLQDSRITAFLNTAKAIILDKMTSFLPPEKWESLHPHETLLHRLSRRRSRDQRLRVFTTNYDLCFERAAANIGCVSIDGFSFMSPRQYDPRYFSYDIIRRSNSSEENGIYLEGVFLLYKLHGSVNWENLDGRIIEKECPDPTKACLIYPARGKYQQSYNQPYIESISQYLAAIREPNTCLLIMGFGFNDNHLSEPILSSVRSNPHLRLIIVDPFVQTNITANSNRYLKVFSELSCKGEDIWFINESFADFVNRIPDLQSLTPADRLYKELKGAMQRQ